MSRIMLGASLVGGGVVLVLALALFFSLQTLKAKRVELDRQTVANTLLVRQLASCNRAAQERAITEGTSREDNDTRWLGEAARAYDAGRASCARNSGLPGPSARDAISAGRYLPSERAGPTNR